MTLPLEIKKNIKFADITTFRLGGYCKGLIECVSVPELKNTVKILNEKNMPFIVVGWGSNILASDKGVDSYVVRFLSEQPCIERCGYNLIVSAGTKLDDLVLFYVENGLGGLTFASGIPGTVGGAVIGNAGAFGKQIGDLVSSVTVLDSEGKEKVFLQKDLGFSYRNSKLKKSGHILLSVEFFLKADERSNLIDERSLILSSRKEKHPDPSITPCAGSFFRNIEPLDENEERRPAGFFLEQCGVKALKFGGAAVYERHANIIVKANDQCTAKDVLGLSLKMQDLVKEKFDIDLIREVVLIGEF